MQCAKCVGMVLECLAKLLLVVITVITHRPPGSSFVGLPFWILNMNHKKELLRGLLYGYRSYVSRSFSPSFFPSVGLIFPFGFIVLLDWLSAPGSWLPSFSSLMLPLSMYPFFVRI